ncbi:hypothetical protein QR680_006053 [Steinernema hermaphroditum]|uniref:Nuclear receptor domain-containing protein n=1 Tax=Steinernema hermaphroditum TaxID=289476 RepID=A0AA39HVI0_9BILA|nr:hypothetical protein QR680_006053 [Steinernema hermaphroditum]
MSEDLNLCVVCGGGAQGTHFNAITCRACAAFFRRSVEGLAETFKCRRATKDCIIKEKSKQNCKYCRFKRCQEEGMVYSGPKESVADRDSCESDVDASPSTSDSGTTPYLDCDNMAFGYNCLHYDSVPLMEQIKTVLSQKPNIGQEVFKPLIRKYKDFKYKHDASCLEIHEYLDFRIWMRNLERGVVKSAEWAMANSEFAALAMEDKWFLFKSFWWEFYAIEITARSVEVFGEPEDTRFVFAENLAIDLFTCKFILPFDERSKEAFWNWYMPHTKKIQSLLIVPLKAVRLTEFEVNYLLLQQLWNYDRVDEISEDAKMVGATVLSKASNEIHRYYVRDMRQDNYAARLAKIMKLRSGLDEFFHFEKSLMKEGELFGIFRNEFMDSPLAADFCYSTQ